MTTISAGIIGKSMKRLFTLISVVLLAAFCASLLSACVLEETPKNGGQSSGTEGSFVSASAGANSAQSDGQSAHPENGGQTSFSAEDQSGASGQSADCSSGYAAQSQQTDNSGSQPTDSASDEQPSSSKKQGLIDQGDYSAHN